MEGPSYLISRERRVEDGEQSDVIEREETIQSLHDLSLSQADRSDNQQHNGDQSDSSLLIHQIGRDLSINCLLRCSRSDYGSIASLNQSFRSLIRSGELYRLRRKMGFVEHWVYLSYNHLEWEAFDPIRLQWMRLPRMTSKCLLHLDKVSLAVGTELLVFAKEMISQSLVIYRYSILTNSWSLATGMNEPRLLFGSASLGEIAIVAGGCDPEGNILSSAELYNSDTGMWETIPSMNKPRKRCTGVFMDGMFYVIGGIGVGNPNFLTCGEAYDLETRTWREIPNMSPPRNIVAGLIQTPPEDMVPLMLAVVKNELYAAYYEEMEVKKYDKERIQWVTVGRLPDRVFSIFGWGLAFRACGDQLILIGSEKFIEVNAWTPDEGQPEWSSLGSKLSGGFVYNCSVMGC